jgi:hypothetical protein
MHHGGIHLNKREREDFKEALDRMAKELTHMGHNVPK